MGLILQGLRTLKMVTQGFGPTGSSPATSYTLNLSSTTGAIGVPVTLTYAGNGTTTAVVNPGSPGIAGTFSPPTVTLNGTSNVTQTFTPTEAGVATFTPTNTGGLTNPSSKTYTAVSSGGGETIQVIASYLLVGIGTSWSGTPFSLVNNNDSTIYYQGVVDATHAVIVIASVNGDTGPYTISDGVVNDIVLPQMLQVPGLTGLLVVNPSSGGRG